MRSLRYCFSGDRARRVSLRRKAEPLLKRGDAAFAAPDDDCIAILRFDSDGSLLFAANRSVSPKHLCLRAGDFRGADSSAIGSVFSFREFDLPPCSSIFIPIE